MSDSLPLEDKAVSAESLRERAREELVRSADEVLRKVHRDEQARRVWEKFDSSSQAKTVVIVGEVGRGKSSLANALVGCAGASPVAVDSATTIPVALTPATESGGLAQLWSSEGVREVPRDRLADFIDSSAVGNSVSVEALADQVQVVGEDFTPTRASVPVAGSAMGECVVIDTPGVGGLVPSHAELASAAVEQACVVVVAVDASTPITSPEMEFIASAGAEADAVVVAVTKTDKNTTRWRDIVADDRRILREHMGREVPVLPVSSVLAVREDPRAQAVSGVEELRGEIEGRFRHAELFPTANALRTLLTQLLQVRADFEQNLRAATHAADAVPSLQADLDRLQALKKDAEQWEQFLQRDLTLLRQQVTASVDARVEEVRTRWTQQISRQSMAVLRKDPQHFTAAMEEDFQRAVVESLEELAGRLREDILVPRFGDDAQAAWEEIEAALAAQVATQTNHMPEVKKKGEGVFDPMMLMMGFTGGSALGGLLATVVSFSGLGVVAGASWIAVNVGFRAMRAGKNNLLQWLGQASQTTRVFTSRLFDAALAQARPTIVIRYRENLRTSIERTQATIREAEAQMSRDKKKRDEAVARWSKNVRVVNSRITAVQALIDEIAAFTQQQAAHG